MQDNPRQAVLYAYIAGIFDGEGTFRISKLKSEKLKRKFRIFNDRHDGMISIGMVNKEIMDLLTKTYGFGKPREERVPDRRSIWRWQSTGRLNNIKFIKTLYPYLIVKKEHAKVLLEFYNKKKYLRKRIKLGSNWRTTDPQEIDRREELYQKMKKLNAVGRAAATTNQTNTRESEVIV